MQKVLVWICIVGGCIILMTIFRAFIITTLQPPEEKQIISVYNGVGTQRATLKNYQLSEEQEHINFTSQMVGRKE